MSVQKILDEYSPSFQKINEFIEKYPNVLRCECKIGDTVMIFNIDLAALESILYAKGDATGGSEA